MDRRHPGPSVRRREIDEPLLAALPDTLHPVLRRVYAARRVPPGEIDPVLARLLPVSGLGGAIDAAQRLADACERRERVVVLGDFDADGATGTALIVSCLKAFGFADVQYLVPDRFRFGYGLSPEIAEQAARARPDLLVTVDNGISSLAGVARARELGFEVMITDHHLPGTELPAADVLVNPNLPGETFGSKSLCGAGVAFYVMAALAAELSKRGHLDRSEGRRIVANGLDLVALGTVADLVPLDYNNRVLVSEGLRRIRGSRLRPGLAALFEVAGRNRCEANAGDLGFAIAPRLNAAGRLTDMSVGIACLLAGSWREALPLARQLDTLNRERRDLQARMEADAHLHVDEIEAASDGPGGDVYCLHHSDWHEGIVGLVASRLKERLKRPVFAFARGGGPGELKGSARSVSGVHIRDILAAISVREPGLIRKFGGHAMAAGLTIRATDLDRFRAVLAAEISAHRELLAEPQQILTDGALDPAEMCLEAAEAIRFGGPWGQGLPEPLFDNELEIVDQRLLKERHLKLRLRCPGGIAVTDAIAFNFAEMVSPGECRTARFVYRLDVNEFGNRRTPQLVVEYIQTPG